MKNTITIMSKIGKLEKNKERKQLEKKKIIIKKYVKSEKSFTAFISDNLTQITLYNI